MERRAGWLWSKLPKPYHKLHGLTSQNVLLFSIETKTLWSEEQLLWFYWSCVSLFTWNPLQCKLDLSYLLYFHFHGRNILFNNNCNRDWNVKSVDTFINFALLVLTSTSFGSTFTCIKPFLFVLIFPFKRFPCSSHLSAGCVPRLRWNYVGIMQGGNYSQTRIILRCWELGGNYADLTIELSWPANAMIGRQRSPLAQLAGVRQSFNFHSYLLVGISMRAGGSVMFFCQEKIQ